MYCTELKKSIYDEVTNACCIEAATEGVLLKRCS